MWFGQLVLFHCAWVVIWLGMVGLVPIGKEVTSLQSLCCLQGGLPTWAVFPCTLFPLPWLLLSLFVPNNDMREMKETLSLGISLPCPGRLWLYVQEARLVLLGPPLYSAGHKTCYACLKERCYHALSF